MGTIQRDALKGLTSCVCLDLSGVVCFFESDTFALIDRVFRPSDSGPGAEFALCARPFI
jgi:hypothetical protein